MKGSVIKSSQHYKVLGWAHRLLPGTAAFPTQCMPKVRGKVDWCPQLLSLDLKKGNGSPKISGDLYKCLKSRSHTTKLPHPQRILEGGADGTLIVTISHTNLLWSLFFREKCSTPRPPLKETSKTLFHLYLWYYFKQFRNQRKEGRRKEWWEGGQEEERRCLSSSGVVFLIVRTSLKHKANLLLNVPGMDSPIHRGMRLAITNSHSEVITLDHSKLFLLPVRQHYRKKNKATELWPQSSLAMLLTLPKATGELKHKI